jgi:hypothetical protein
MGGGFSIRMQPTTTTQPAGNRDVSRAAQGLPQVCRPLASAQPTPDRDLHVESMEAAPAIPRADGGLKCAVPGELTMDYVNPGDH